jgi:hypothetical protein
MAAVSKSYGVGDTVWVHYLNSIALQWLPVQRIVKKVEITTSTNEATVHFTVGESIIDGAVKTVYNTRALCATGIVDYLIAQSVAVSLLDPTLSIASTVSQGSDTLGRIGNGTSGG